MHVKMMRKCVEDSLTLCMTISRMWSRPVCRSSILVRQKPIQQEFVKGYSGFMSLRLHHILNNDVKSSPSCICPLRLPMQVLCLPTVRHGSSTLQEHNTEQSSELDTLYKWIELRCKGHDDAVLESYQMFVSMAAKELGIHIDCVVKPKKKIERLTLLKSRHIYKKHRVQYEMRTHFRIITLKHLTGSTADVFLEYIERNLPEGVAMQVKKCHLEKMPSHLTSAPADAAEESITAAGESDSSLGEDVNEASSSSSDSSSSDSSDEEKPPSPS